MGRISVAQLSPPRWRRRARRGSAVVEASFLIPWALLLFIGIFDFGFYNYALIATSNAARVAGLFYSSAKGAPMTYNDVCGYVLNELRSLPNVRSSVSTCVTSASALTASQPVALVVSQGVGPDNRQASTVTVFYRTMSMIPFPGYFGTWISGGAVTLGSRVQMRIDNT